MSEAAIRSGGPGVVVAALKWADLFVDVDPLTGEATADPKGRGFSAADEAALELALRLGARWSCEVVAITAGSDGASAGLARAVSVGADRSVLVGVSDEQPSSLNVARALAWGLRSADLHDPVIVCGDYSADRGSGSVPAALAALTGLPQALGLVVVDLGGDGALRVQRRLDGARREELLVRPPAVLSVEGSVGRLRRAPLSGALVAAEPLRLTPPSDVEVAEPTGVGETGPAIPRTRRIPAPAGEDALARVEALTGTQATSTPTQALAVSPEEAARHLLEAWAASGGAVPEGAVGSAPASGSS
ncbi:MAG: mycofactocin-associated electron transfer flavoprotein beta subunit [Microthrixaceae bacterium]